MKLPHEKTPYELPYFEDVTQEMNERRQHKKFLAADMATESNKPLFSLLQNIGIGFVIAFLLTFGVAVLVYNDAPTWIWSVVIPIDAVRNFGILDDRTKRKKSWEKLVMF